MNKPLIVLALIVLVIGCETLVHRSDILDNKVQSVPPISWEQKRGPIAKEWTKATVEGVTALFASFDKAEDSVLFCPKYKTLTKEQKITLWTEMFSAIAFFESSWDPINRMEESQTSFPDPDPVTGNPVTSEGLLQMSYQDTVNYAHWLGKGWCGFDWQKDRLRGANDPLKTILDAKINLSCGIKVMANQIERRGSVILSSGVYWAVLKRGGTYSRVEQITAMTKKVQGCQ